ncbi:GerAB/ArcD/ProY family transporter [Limnochorda pilosa]|uniref:Spore germination protein n=1 Tax=Limnochorda pilosa TaxID=1555112 RepID=A0A0K2SJN7_LIMPI|nr:endospore germination permease [Limnochorda pilosa]BAS27326.1 hypothetical protein LIP_1477 [Limnochorda pilosa]
MPGRVDGGKISALEGSLLVVSAILPWAVLFIPVLAIETAGQDAWLSSVPATLLGIGVAFLATALARRFPGETLIGFTLKTMGRPLGYLIGAAYVVWLTSVAALTARGFGELITTMILPRTPISVVIGALIAVVATNVRGGIEVIARANQVIVPIVVAFLATLAVLSFKDVDPRNWQPVLERGLLPVLQGQYIAGGFFGEVMVAAIMILPFLNRKAASLRVLVLPILALGLLMMGTSLWYVGVLGAEVAGRLVFLPVEIAKHVSIANFLERLEAVSVSLWVTASFAKLSIWCYGATLAAAELLRLQDYRPLAWPIGLLVGELSVLFFNDQAEFFRFVRWSATPYMLVFEAVIPLLLLGVASARGARGPRPGTASTLEEPPSPPKV